MKRKSKGKTVKHHPHPEEKHAALIFTAILLLIFLFLVFGVVLQGGNY